MELPPLPPPYTPPPERWFDRYEIDTASYNPSETLNAMWLTLLDRLGRDAAPRKFTPAERTMLDRMYKRYGIEIMAIWRSMCDNVTGEPEQAFLRLLSGRVQ